VSTPAGWRIAGLTCYATDPSAWRRRTAAGYTPNRPWPGVEFRRHVLELAAARGLTSPVICELGIGSGRVARSFIEAGDRYIGIDNDPVMIDELIASLGGECPPNLQLVKSDIKLGIPLPDNSVDIIIEVQVFSSFDRDIARERARILRPNGFVLARFSGNQERHVGDGDPPSWQQVYDYDAWIHRKLNVYMTRGREPWPKESSISKPRPAADPASGVAPSDLPPPPPDPDYRWQKDNPFASLTYPFSLRQHYRELRLNRLVFMTVGPEPWWSERARLLDAEAERLGITFTDSVLRERWVTGELWEASTLKRWAALAGGSFPSLQ
jgi:SAM-dependent methyltransferase